MRNNCHAKNVNNHPMPVLRGRRLRNNEHFTSVVSVDKAKVILTAEWNVHVHAFRPNSILSKGPIESIVQMFELHGRETSIPHYVRPTWTVAS